MENTSVYSKTARGLAELKTSTRNLSREQIRTLIMIDGRSTIADFSRELSAAGCNALMATVRELDAMGLIRAIAKSRPDEVAGDDGHHRQIGGLPVIEVTELSGEESVQAWAQARRGARALQEKGYFAPHARDDVPNGAEAVAGTRHALVIEDDESIAQLLEMLLTEKGFLVSAAADIGTAMSMLERAAGFDLVLLDVVLPGAAGKDGFHILEKIRKTPHLHHLPVIMVTSQVSDEQVLRGLKAGADGYIFKPIKWEALYQCIRSVAGA